jgi:hypothetical protein
MTTGVSDILTSWRTLLLNPSHKPDATVTTSHTMISSDMSVTIPTTGAQDALAVRQWIDQHVKPHRRPRVFRRFAYRVYYYVTVQEFIGLTFEFPNPIDATHFKLRWA